MKAGSIYDLGKKNGELSCHILRGVSLSDDYLCQIYAGCQASPFSLYTMLKKEEGGWWHWIPLGTNSWCQKIIKDLGNNNPSSVSKCNNLLWPVLKAY